MASFKVNTSQELNELIKEVSNQRRKYYMNKIILDLVSECTRDNCDIDSKLQSKLSNLLASADVESCMELRGNTTLLGVKLEPINLSYMECDILKETVQLKLREKHQAVFKELSDLGVPTEDKSCSLSNISSLSLSVQDNILLELKRQLNEMQELYLRSLMELRDILESIINLKVKTLADTTNDAIKSHQVQSQLFCLRTKILDAKLKIKVFTESPMTLSAFKEVLKDISEQQKEYKEEIESLAMLKEKYKQVSCKQYDEILKSYKQYKSSIEKIKSYSCLIKQ